MRGEGNSGRRGGANGDLFVQISVKDHPDLRRDGTTIHSDVEVSFTEAILGTQVGTEGRVCGGGGGGREREGEGSPTSPSPRTS